MAVIVLLLLHGHDPHLFVFRYFHVFLDNRFNFSGGRIVRPCGGCACVCCCRRFLRDGGGLALCSEVGRPLSAVGLAMAVLAAPIAIAIKISVGILATAATFSFHAFSAVGLAAFPFSAFVLSTFAVTDLATAGRLSSATIAFATLVAFRSAFVALLYCSNIHRVVRRSHDLSTHVVSPARVGVLHEVQLQTLVGGSRR